MNEKEVESFKNILKEIEGLRLNKSADYGNSWKIFGLMGIIYQIMSKAIRIWNLRNKDPKNESLRDSFRDIAVYGTMAMQLLDSGEIEPLI